MRQTITRSAIIGVLLLGVLVAPTRDASADDPQPRLVGMPPPPSESDRDRFVRRTLEDARAFRLQGRLDAAERAVVRGLAARPDEPRLLREHARILDLQDRSEEAERIRRSADAADPTPPAPPPTALDTDSRGVLAILVPPSVEREARGRVPDVWPDTLVAETLERRLRTRLPEARVAYADPGSVDEARAWIGEYAPRVALSLRVDRAFCDESLKDGPFAVAELRVAAATPGEIGDPPQLARSVRLDPPQGDVCLSDIVARALEEALGLPAVGATLADPASEAEWSAPSLRAIFPGLDARLHEEIAAGKRRLATGHVALAAESFARAAQIDPDDPETLTYQNEVATTLSIAGELSRPGASAGVLDPRFTPAQHAAAEQRLGEEQRRRESLLAALAVLDEDAAAPSTRTVAALRPTPITDTDAVGPTLARELAGGSVTARIAYAPDGSALSRYFLPEGSERPILREEDSNGDGRPDRWIVYNGDVRQEIREDSRGSGQIDLRLVFAADGRHLDRIELDHSDNGHNDRVFYYAEGRLRVEARDTQNDGVLDRFDRFDPEGRLEVREEDRNGDGRIDIRSVYDGGKLVRREITDPAAAGEELPSDPRAPQPR